MVPTASGPHLLSNPPQAAGSRSRKKQIMAVFWLLVGVGLLVMAGVGLGWLRVKALRVYRWMKK